MVNYSNRMNGVKASVVRELSKLLGDPQMISFGGGNPANESLPVAVVDELVHEVLSENGETILQYGITEGYQPLRESYVEHIAAPKGLKIGPDNVLVMTGAMQGLDLINKLFLNPGETVLVENPTFAGALQAFRIAQGNIVPVQTDEEGVILEDLEAKIKEHHPKLFYCIPTFQNPSGKTIGLERRKAIAELASRYDFIVMEDDPYGDLRFRGESLPPIKYFDRTGNVIMMNSFSKILSPGIRVGTLVASEEIVDKASICKQCSDTHTTNLTQAVADRFLRKGLLPGHLQNIIPMYLKKLDTMLGSIEAYFPEGTVYTKPDGGLFVWIELPHEINMGEAHKRAIAEKKVAFVPGMAFCVGDPAMGRRTLRLNYSNATPEDIAVGVERLASLIKTYL